MTERRSNLTAKAGVLTISAILFLSSLVLFQPSIATASTCTTTYSASPTYDTATMVPITIMSPGTYCFGAGTYNTQITITASGVTLTTAPGVRSGQAIIEPTTVASHSSDPGAPDFGITPGAAQYSIILAGSDSASITGVTISNLVVDGSKASSPSCTTGYNGVEFLNAGGAITGNTVLNVYVPVALAESCTDYYFEPGNTILVQTGSGFSSAVTISGNQALNYENEGVGCLYAGTTCRITHNTATFYVPRLLGAPSTSYSPFNVPIGIGIYFGATGTASGNTVSGNECNITKTSSPYDPSIPYCGPNEVTQFEGDGIFIYYTGAATTIEQNTVIGNDQGIESATESGDFTTTASNNQLQGNRYYGIVVYDSVGLASNNQISGSSVVGIIVVQDGCFDNPTIANLMGNNFNQGTYSIAPVQVITLSDPAFCTPNYPEHATLNLNNLVETVSGGTLSSPSIVNLNDFPGLR
jgi:parallel beta-helix repeat protein